jgi:hypothetical protein
VLTVEIWASGLLCQARLTAALGEREPEHQLGMAVTDMTWPRNDDEDFLSHRALAWSRCRDHLPDWPEPTDLSEP